VSAAPRAVEMAIGEVVLSGFPPLDRHRLGDALAAELTTLLARRGLPEGLAADPVLPPVVLRLAPGAGPEAIGREIARAVHAGLLRSAAAASAEDRS
jgi:hypothetical protein